MVRTIHSGKTAFFGVSRGGLKNGYPAVYTHTHNSAKTFESSQLYTAVCTYSTGIQLSN